MSVCAHKGLSALSTQQYVYVQKTFKTLYIVRLSAENVTCGFIISLVISQDLHTNEFTVGFSWVLALIYATFGLGLSDEVYSKVASLIYSSVNKVWLKILPLETSAAYPDVEKWHTSDNCRCWGLKSGMDLCLSSWLSIKCVLVCDARSLKHTHREESTGLTSPFSCC